MSAILWSTVPQQETLMLHSDAHHVEDRCILFANFWVFQILTRAPYDDIIRQKIQAT
jgi:hypothetical protein